MWFRLKDLDAGYPARAPRRFVIEREVACSAERLFAMLGDPSEWPRWFPDMRAMRWISPEGERAKVGAIRRADTGSGDVIEHFVAWESPRHIAFYAEKMTTPLATEFFEDYVITPLGESRARLTWTVGYQLRLPLRPLAFLIVPRFAKMFDDAGDALVKHVAAGAPR
ncbi:MAG: SRPBCC family protein [Sandaracinus sp.]